ncbi:MAG: ABC transporter permease [Chloroflexota bacterium]
MSVIYSKIWRDVWHNKARTLQVILIIALGAIAIGMVIGARNLIAEAMAISWQAASPSMINLQVDPPMNDNELLTLKKLKGVAEVEGVLTAGFEWRLTPDDEWQVGVLYARDDYADQKMNTVQLVSGEWPHQKNLAVGEGFDTAFGVYEGDNLQLKINDREYETSIEGVIYNAAQPPLAVDGLQLYTTRERFSQLTGQENFNIIQTRDVVFDQAIQEQADLAIQEHLAKLEINSAGLGGPGRDRVVDPQIHPLQDNLDTIFWILGVMGGLTIILGLFLVYNTINAILAEQVKQIGMMKAIGASAGQVLWIYLNASFIYGLFASLVAIPLGAVGARYLALFLLDLFNVNPGPFTVDPLAAQIQVGVALLSPLVASLFPIMAGVRLTVREALGSYGLEGAAASLADRLVAHLHRVPYTLLLTLGNTFRNKNRVFFLQITLVGSGFVFMTVMGVRDSFIHTFTGALTSIHTYDLIFERKRSNRAGFYSI